MSERDAVLANYMLASIQKDLGFLKDNQYLPAQTYSEICALLPSKVSTMTAPVSDFKKPPLPTRKSGGGAAPGLAPVPAAREMPKLPARRSTVEHQHIPSPAPRPQPSPRPSPHLKSAVNVMPLPAAAPAPVPAPIAAPTPAADPSPPPPAYTTTTALATAEAVYDYDGDDPKTDLSFRRGEVIQVTKYVNDDWWRGELHGKSGIFPQNHVKKIPTPSEPAKRAVPAKPATLSVHASSTPPYSYPAPPTTMYHAPPPQQGQQTYYAAPPPPQTQTVVAEQPQHEGGEGKDSMAKKVGGKVASAAVFGFGATLGSKAADAIF